MLFAPPPPYWQLLGSHFAIAPPLGTLVATNDTLSVPLNTWDPPKSPPPSLPLRR